MGFRRYRLGMEWTDSLFKLVSFINAVEGSEQAVVHPLPPVGSGTGEPIMVIQAIREALEGKKLHTRRRIAVGGSHPVMRDAFGLKRALQVIRDQVPPSPPALGRSGV